MVELKTLKDLKLKYPFETLEKGQRTGMIKKEIKEIVFCDKLKAEAAKWAKHCDHYKYVAELAWIINFFNLTSEDLK